MRKPSIGKIIASNEVCYCINVVSNSACDSVARCEHVCLCCREVARRMGLQHGTDYVQVCYGEGGFSHLINDLAGLEISASTNPIILVKLSRDYNLTSYSP